MADTVKLIIEIPKEAKQVFDCAESNDLKGGYYDNGGIIGKAIQNGIPLEQHEYRQKMFSYLDGVANGLNESNRDTIDVLDKIRAEIEMEKLEDSPNFCIKAHNNAVDRVLQIIDKYKADTEVDNENDV